ncbi:TIR domain-containing protein [Pseudomonas sp. BJa5]|uniref:toll/interleukin-1 receptor domain-containing protein n=1 Tax=Pseudomonas sp. BJa5 TaxID=2936270 RepID=UPI002559FBE2|nr:toll/interleukin-1 receptor domain-containing protein [Pseudomonas sp. BGr12]MDL2422047.1 toll/interleukin-1 receptor domain-containing protein [Pseudomonas sp. BGr12]
MPVFISYRHQERLDAFIINERLKLEGIPTHLDLFDSGTHQTTDDISGQVSRNLSNCTHLIAVLSQENADAWWVPFQLGAATLTHRRASLFQCGESPLPGYLEKWPIMSSREHIDLYVRAYHDEQTFKRAITEDSSEANATNRANADFFHADLKAKIRRGF